jgi:hypothetical protein
VLRPLLLRGGEERGGRPEYDQEDGQEDEAVEEAKKDERHQNEEKIPEK